MKQYSQNIQSADFLGDTMLKPFEIHPEYRDLFQTVQKEYQETGVFFLEESYLRNLNDQLTLFPGTIDSICADAAAIRRDPQTARYALFVVRAMEHRHLFLKNLSLFTFPDKEYPFLALLCLIPSIPGIHRFLQERNLPEDVICSTLGQFEACVFIYSQRFDRPGLNKRYFDWLQHYVDFKILNIGRLRFEILTLEDPIYLLRHRETGEQRLLMGGPEMNSHGLYADTPPLGAPAFRACFRETDAFYEGTPVSCRGRCLAQTARFSKDVYDLILRPGDICLSVHIPDTGDFSRQSCEMSYARALAIFREQFPEITVKAFHCHSWMMAPELDTMLKADSRILAFNRDYIRYPIPTQGQDVLNFVFLLKYKTYDDLAEDTSLQRALKALYVNGQYLYEYGGIFIPDSIP